MLSKVIVCLLLVFVRWALPTSWLSDTFLINNSMAIAIRKIRRMIIYSLFLYSFGIRWN